MIESYLLLLSLLLCSVSIHATEEGVFTSNEDSSEQGEHENSTESFEDEEARARLRSRGQSQQFENDSRNILDYINRSGGGNVDGGGTDIEYPTLKDLDDALAITFNSITTKVEGKNFVRRLRDEFPNDAINDLYADALGDFEVTSIHQLKYLRLESSNEAFLQMIVGDRFETYVDRYKSCRFYSKKVVNIYTDQATDIFFDDCEQVYEEYHSDFLDVFDMNRFQWQEKCYDSFGEEKIGSVSDFSLNAEICLSKSKFLKIPKDNLMRTFFSVVLHEISHMFGSNEEQAKRFEHYILDHFNSIYKSINNVEQEISDRRSAFSYAFAVLKVAQGRIRPFTRDYYFRYATLEESLLDLLYDNFYSREEFLFLYPYEVVEKVNTHLEKVKDLIKTHFTNDYNLIPREDIFREDEILVMRGVKRIDSPSGLSLEYKLNKFLKGIQTEVYEIIKILDSVDDSVSLSNRRDALLYIDYIYENRDNFLIFRDQNAFPFEYIQRDLTK